MSNEIPWGQYERAYKAIYEKTADISAKMDNLSAPMFVQLCHAGAKYDARNIRVLTSSDVVSAAKSGTWNIDNLLNPHPISNPNLDVALSTRSNLMKTDFDAKLDVALSTRLKPADLNLDAEKDLQIDVKTLPSLPAGTAKIGAVNVDIPKTFKTAKIDHAVSGDNAIVAAVAGKRIKVYGIVLVVSAAVDCKWRSGTTDLTGDMNFGGKGEGYAQAVQPPAFLFATAIGEALNLNLAAAVAVDGYVSYWDDDSE